MSKGTTLPGKQANLYGSLSFFVSAMNPSTDFTAFLLYRMSIP